MSPETIKVLSNVPPLKARPRYQFKSVAEAQAVVAQVERALCASSTNPLNDFSANVRLRVLAARHPEAFAEAIAAAIPERPTTATAPSSAAQPGAIAAEVSSPAAAQPIATAPEPAVPVAPPQSEAGLPRSSKPALPELHGIDRAIAAHAKSSAKPAGEWNGQVQHVLAARGPALKTLRALCAHLHLGVPSASAPESEQRADLERRLRHADVHVTGVDSSRHIPATGLRRATAAVLQARADAFLANAHNS